MAKSPDSRARPSQPDIDISAPKSGPKLGWRGTAFIWGGFFVLMVLLFYFRFSYWVLIGTVLAILLAAVGWIGWIVVVRRGAFTWMPLALKPATRMAAGDAEAAERVCAQALARARQFAPDDHRRGLMLCELAMFIKNQGRQAEAMALYEESVGILARHASREPFDYFVALNNYGICFIHLKDYEAAQTILERAIDMILATRARESNQFIMMALAQVQALEFVLRLNLAFLFLEMGEQREAEMQLREADAIVPLLSKKIQASWNDHYVAICALWELEAGNFEQAEKEFAQAGNPDYPACLRGRTRLHLARGEFALSEELSRKYLAEERKKGTLHRPDLLKAHIDLADALFGQGKRDEALSAFAEARGIVADFEMPGDNHWRATLERWLPRLREANQEDVAFSLQKQIEQMAAAPSKAIMILEKFRVKPPASVEA